MKIIRLAVASLLAAFVAAASNAQDTKSEGTVLTVSGTVMVKLPDASAPVPATVGMKLPQDAEITTGSDGKVFVEVHEGMIATAEKNSTVVVEKLSVSANGTRNATLNLKSGNLISTLDPAKRNINNYGVRTPKGVAAARGTSYSVAVSNGGFSIAATADAVTFTDAAGGVFSINAGMISITPPGGLPQPPVSLASAAVTNPEVAAVMQQAVDTISRWLSTSFLALFTPPQGKNMKLVKGV